MSSPSNPLVVWTDRSRQISYQECPRRRYLTYHLNGTGVTPEKIIIPLGTGIWTHEGLAALLTGRDIDSAVKIATDGYWTEVKRRGLQVEPGQDGSEVAEEQIALVEGMLRAYYLRKLPELLEQYEVLEAEVEEEWPLGQIAETSENGALHPTIIPIQMMSRLDALLLDRRDNYLYIQSFKTAASYDRRNAAEAEHDVQGLSEMAAVEYRLNRWWNAMMIEGKKPAPGTMSDRMEKFLISCTEPPKIMGIRMEYLLKGRRMEYPEGSGHYEQYSPLIRGYQKFGPTVESSEYGWKREYKDDAGNTKRLDYRTWKPFSAWKANGGVKAWIELLNSGTIQPEAGDCLASQFVTPVPYFRQDDDLRDWYEQTVEQEETVARKLRIMNRIEKEYGQVSMEFRSALNKLFPQHRRSCDWPSSCACIDICYSTNVKNDPVGSGLYVPRTPHHKPELQALMPKSEPFLPEQKK